MAEVPLLKQQRQRNLSSSIDNDSGIRELNTFSNNNNNNNSFESYSNQNSNRNSLTNPTGTGLLLTQNSNTSNPGFQIQNQLSRQNSNTNIIFNHQQSSSSSSKNQNNNYSTTTQSNVFRLDAYEIDREALKEAKKNILSDTPKPTSKVEKQYLRQRYQSLLAWRKILNLMNPNLRPAKRKVLSKTYSWNEMSEMNSMNNNNNNHHHHHFSNNNNNLGTLKLNRN